MIIALLSVWLAGASEEGRTRTVEVEGFEPAPALSVAYRGAGAVWLQPGASARLEWTARRREIEVSGLRRKRGFRHRTREILYAADVGFSSQLYNNTLFQLRADVATRQTRTSGFTTAPALGLGVSRAVLNHPSWHINRNGVARRQYLQGEWSGLLSASYTVGFDLQRRRETRIRRGRSHRTPLSAPLELYVRPTAVFLMPWAGFAATHAYMEFGVRRPLAAWRGR